MLSVLRMKNIDIGQIGGNITAPELKEFYHFGRVAITSEGIQRLLIGCPKLKKIVIESPSG